MGYLDWDFEKSVELQRFSTYRVVELERFSCIKNKFGPRNIPEPDFVLVVTKFG